MSEKGNIRGGRNVAMKVPSHQFDATVASYRALDLPVVFESESVVTFEFGPIMLHIDRRDGFSQAELWLELVSNDLKDTAARLDSAGFDRRDEIENLGNHNGFWVSNPASIVHLVSHKDEE